MSYQRGSYNMLSRPQRSNPKNAANMPIFMDESGTDSGKPVSDSLGFKSLQKYGSERSGKTFDYQKEPATPFRKTDTSYMDTPSVQNFTNVDEEDEFLYGDTNSLPEEPNKESTLSANASDIGLKEAPSNSGWSDEDDFFIEAVYDKNAPKMPTTSTWERKEKTQDEQNFKSSAKALSVEKPLSKNQHFSSINIQAPAAKSDLSLHDVNTNKSMDLNSNLSSIPMAKSKYHAAAEILKKKTIEKNINLQSKASDSFVPDKVVTEKSPDIPLSNTRTVVLPKNAKKISLEKPSPSVASTSSPLGDQRRPAKHFFQKDLDNISKILQSPSIKHSLPPQKMEQDLKMPYKGHKEDSPSRYPRMHSRSPSPKKYPRYQSRSPSYGSRPRSPYSSRHRSPGYRPRHKSPSTYRHPLYDEYKHHDPRELSPHHRHPYEKHRRYSRSPGKDSRGKSPDYRYRDSRSRSPSYQSSRSAREKYYKSDVDKRKVLLKSSEFHYSKDKSRGSSSDSFCSLSFDSGSSDSQSKNFKKKKTSKMPTDEQGEIDSKNTPTGESFSKTDQGIPSSSHKDASSQPASQTDITKDLNEEELKLLKMLTPFDGSLNFINEFMRAQETNSMPENQFPAPTQMFQNIPDPNFIVAESIPTPMPTPPMYPYNPIMQNAPHVFQPPGCNFMPAMPQYPPADYSQPPMMHPYDSYVAPPITVPSNDVKITIPLNTNNLNETRQIRNKANRTQTLRDIPVSKTFSSVSQSLLDKSNLIEVAKSKSPVKTVEKEDTNVSKSLPKKTALTVSKPVERKPDEHKTTMIEKYKTLKADRYYAQAKVNSIVSDMVEMRNLVDETWSKRGNISSNEKNFYSKCKNILIESDDKMRQNIKEAKQCDEELSRYKGKLPAEILAEVSKLRTEDYIKEAPITTEKYLMFDSGKHICNTCNLSYSSIPSMLEHLHSCQHKEKMDQSDNDWLNKFRRKPMAESQLTEKKGVLQPVVGIEFMKPSTGFFCALCKEYCIDQQDAEIHLKESEHNIKFKKYIRDNPLYQNKRTVKRFVQCSISSKEKRKKEADEQEEKTVKRRKQEDFANKVKEMVKNQKNKEKKLEELEEHDTSNVESSPKLPGIKLTLSADKDGSKSNDSKSTDNILSANKDAEENKKEAKAKPQVVYIGRQPNFKSKNKPWYKRETYTENAERQGSDIIKSLKEKISLSKQSSDSSFKKGSSNDKFEKTTLPTEGTGKSGTSNAGTNANKEKSSVENSTTSDKSKKKDVFYGPVYDSSANEKKNTSEKTDSTSDASHKSQPKNDVTKNSKVAAVKEALKKFVQGTNLSSAFPLSDIQLPATPKKKKKEVDLSVPMDISPERHSREKTEEEKDFYLLGINKEDMRPIANIVPPPSSTASYQVNTNYFQNVPPPVVTNYVPVANITLPNLNVPPPNYVPPPVISPIKNIPPLNLSIPPPNIFNRGGGMNISPNQSSINVQNTYYSPPPAYNKGVVSNKVKGNTNLIQVPMQKYPPQPTQQSNPIKKAQQSTTMKTNQPEKSSTTPIKIDENKNTLIGVKPVLSKPPIPTVQSKTKTADNAKNVAPVKIADSVKDKETADKNALQSGTEKKVNDISANAATDKTQLEAKNSVKNNDTVQENKIEGKVSPSNVVQTDVKSQDKGSTDDKDLASSAVETKLEQKLVSKVNESEKSFQQNSDIEKGKLEVIDLNDDKISLQTENKVEMSHISKDIELVPCSTIKDTSDNVIETNKDKKTPNDSVTVENKGGISEFDISKNESNDNAESVFNFQAFDKLAALAKDTKHAELESVNFKNSFVFKGQTEDSNEAPPPILEQEMNKNTPAATLNNKISESICLFQNMSSENLDSNQSAPPILELEVVKTTNASHETKFTNAVIVSSNEHEKPMELDNSAGTINVEQCSDVDKLPSMKIDEENRKIQEVPAEGVTEDKVSQVSDSTVSSNITERILGESIAENKIQESLKTLEEEKNVHHDLVQLKGNETEKTEEDKEIAEILMNPAECAAEDSGSETDEYENEL